VWYFKTFFFVYYLAAKIYMSLSLQARFAARAHYLKYWGGRFYSDHRTAESLNTDYTHVFKYVINPNFDNFSWQTLRYTLSLVHL